MFTFIYPCMLNCIMHIRPAQLKLFYGKVPGRTFMSTGTKHLAPKNSHYENLVSGVFPKGAIKMQIRNAYFRSQVHSSQKLCPEPNSAGSSCIQPCKIGGTRTFLTFVHLLKCHLKLSGSVGKQDHRKWRYHRRLWTIKSIK